MPEMNEDNSRLSKSGDMQRAFDEIDALLLRSEPSPQEEIDRISTIVRAGIRSLHLPEDFYVVDNGVVRACHSEERGIWMKDYATNMSPDAAGQVSLVYKAHSPAYMQFFDGSKGHFLTTHDEIVNDTAELRKSFTLLRQHLKVFSTGKIVREPYRVPAGLFETLNIAHMDAVHGDGHAVQSPFSGLRYRLSDMRNMTDPYGILNGIFGSVNTDIMSGTRDETIALSRTRRLNGQKVTVRIIRDGRQRVYTFSDKQIAENVKNLDDDSLLALFSGKADDAEEKHALNFLQVMSPYIADFSRNMRAVPAAEKSRMEALPSVSIGSPAEHAAYLNRDAVSRIEDEAKRIRNDYPQLQEFLMSIARPRLSYPDFSPETEEEILRALQEITMQDFVMGILRAQERAVHKQPLNPQDESLGFVIGCHMVKDLPHGSERWIDSLLTPKRSPSSHPDGPDSAVFAKFISTLNISSLDEPIGDPPDTTLLRTLQDRCNEEQFALLGAFIGAGPQDSLIRQTQILQELEEFSRTVDNTYLPKISVLYGFRRPDVFVQHMKWIYPSMLLGFQCGDYRGVDEVVLPRFLAEIHEAENISRQTLGDVYSMLRIAAFTGVYFSRAGHTFQSAEPDR